MAAYGYDETLVPLPIQGFSTHISGYDELLSALPVHPLHVCVPLALPHRQIRLLELDPVHSRDPNTAPPLHGRLRVVSLESHQEYSALSYVWSQEDPGTSKRENRLVIHCNEHQHEARIGPNCWSALWHLSKARGGLVIWVDSVCIDQKDNEEKTQQIPLMRTIYKSARTTYFWLGEAEEGTDEAINYLSTNVLSISQGTAFDILKAAIILFLRRHTFQVHPHRSALHKLFSRPWIDRLWTLQEAVESSNGEVVCGERSILWEDLICALESINFFRTQTMTLFFEDSYIPWLNLTYLSRWLTDSNARGTGEHHMLVQSCGTFDALSRIVHRQLNCLTVARYWHFFLCFIFLGLCLLSFAYVVRGVPLNPWEQEILVFLVPVCVYAYFWLFNTIARRTARNMGLSPRFRVETHSIVQELRSRKVADPRDIYFGTLGILGDGSIVTEGSISALYQRLCASLIRRIDSLNILLLANAGMENKFPSWVVDWRLKTPHVWEKAMALSWTSATRQFPTECVQQDSTLMQSEFCMRLQKICKSLVRNSYWCLLVAYRFELGTYVRLHRYEGATPGSKPFWEFRNQGEHLCVHGLILSDIVSNFTPRSTRLGTIESQPILRAPTTASQLAQIGNSFIAEFSSASSAEEATIGHSQVCMFTAFVHSALWDMTEAERMKTVDRCNELIDVFTDNRDSEQILWMWWQRLVVSLANNQGPAWAESLLADDKSVEDRLHCFMDFLAAEGLCVVRCQRTELSRGSLAFATAAVHEGDSVALVSGVTYPLVLRPWGEQHFKLIGPVFLPSAMDGELVELLTPESEGDLVLV